MELVNNDNVTELAPAMSADVVLDKAKGQYKSLVIIGYDNDGNLDIRSDMGFTHERVLWAMESFKHKLLNGDYSGE